MLYITDKSKFTYYKVNKNFSIFGGIANMPGINNNLDLSKIYNLNANPDTQNLENASSAMNMFGYDFFSKDDIVKEELKDKNIDQEGLTEDASEAENTRLVDLKRQEEKLTNYAEETFIPDIFEFQPLQTEKLEDFLKTQSGKLATVEMLIGGSQSVNKIGEILTVGENYLLLRETQTGNILVCPLKNIEFIRLNY